MSNGGETCDVITRGSVHCERGDVLCDEYRGWTVKEMKLTEDVKILIRRVHACFERERKRRRPEITYDKVNKRVARALKLTTGTISKVVKRDKKW